MVAENIHYQWYTSWLISYILSWQENMQIWFFHIWINILNFIIQCFQPVLLKKWRVIFSFLLYRYMKVVRYVMGIERYLKSISFKYWNEHYILLKYSPRFDLHNFNPWSHFWNASHKWFNLGWSGRYEMMAEQKNCRDLERRPDKWNGKRKKSRELYL